MHTALAMRKSVWIFLLAVLLPSALLGLLALRSAEEQKIILERRTAELYQKETENAAAGVRCLLYTSPSPRDGLLSRMPSSA